VTALGSSFTRWRAEDLGLDYRVAFSRLCRMRLAVIRLSASWREIAEFGWQHLDWLMAEAAETNQQVVLTVGMKALGWPEFYLPAGLDPADLAVQREAVRQVRAAVFRYAGHPTLVGWQIENEPFNRSGPQARWIPRPVVRSEADAVRAIDASHPLLVTCFGHFTEDMDRASSRHQSDWKRRLRLDLPAEREALSILRPGDILGLDVYRTIGWVDGQGEARISRSDDRQQVQIRSWQRIARRQRKRLWVTEAQAEPWEARRDTHGNPLTVQPADLQPVLDTLIEADVETVLLWGSEYWLWRELEGDPRWIDAIALGQAALASKNDA
jgi:hypothetical protein